MNSKNTKDKEKAVDENLLKWLSTTGFPLEMAAAAAFREFDFSVQQSYTYADPQTDKAREIDVLATDSDTYGFIEIFFVLECKSSLNPWVVFVSDDALLGQTRDEMFALMTPDAQDAINKRMAEKLGKIKPYFPANARCGYGFRQAFGRDNDPAYVASMGVIKACQEAIPHTQDPNDRHYAFAFPVIVIDSPLYECSLDEDGEICVKEVQISEFLFSAHIPKKKNCKITVITKDSLPSFARWARNLSNSIREELKPEEAAYLADE